MSPSGSPAVIKDSLAACESSCLLIKAEVVAWVAGIAQPVGIFRVTSAERAFSLFTSWIPRLEDAVMVMFIQDLALLRHPRHFIFYFFLSAWLQ